MLKLNPPAVSPTFGSNAATEEPSRLGFTLELPNLVSGQDSFDTVILRKSNAIQHFWPLAFGFALAWKLISVVAQQHQQQLIYSYKMQQATSAPQPQYQPEKVGVHA